VASGNPRGGDKKPWDFADTPPEKYPLLLNFHPLVIYRHNVIKQADIVLAMFLLGSQFSLDQKRRKFDYYDPLTTGVQSILAMELGYRDKAIEYLRYALWMDLADVHANVDQGCHIASMGGTWMSVLYGIAGMREHNGRVCFHPRLGQRIEGLRFHLTIQGQLLTVDIEGRKGQTTYLLREGSGLTFGHMADELKLELGKPVSRDSTLPMIAVATDNS
jgi:alpha,alpha-trehalose phosphorylase